MDEIEIFRALEKRAHPRDSLGMLPDLRLSVWNEIRAKKQEQSRTLSSRMRMLSIGCAAAAMLIMSVNLYMFNNSRHAATWNLPVMTLVNYCSGGYGTDKP